MEQFLKIHVFPDSKKQAVDTSDPKRLRVFVKSSAQNNMANKEVLMVLARHLDIPVTRLRIIQGHTSIHKTIEIK